MCVGGGLSMIRSRKVNIPPNLLNAVSAKTPRAEEGVLGYVEGDIGSRNI